MTSDSDGKLGEGLGSRLGCTASDGKLGEGLGTRLGDGFLLYCRLRNLTEIDFTLKAARCNYLTCTGFLTTKLLREPLV